MTKKLFRKYQDNPSYLADASNRPTDKSTVSYTRHGVRYDGVNIIVDAILENCEVGDMLVFDKQEQAHKILKMATYNASSFNTDRYIKSDTFYHVSVMGVGIFLHKGQSSGAWAARCEFKISGIDLSQAGSFDFLSTGYQAKATATTIAWEAGATLESVKSQFTTGNGGVIGSGSYSSITIDGNDLIIMVGGYGTNNITLSNLTDGGAEVVLTDYSKTCKIGDAELTEEGDLVHRSFQGSKVATCFPSIASELLAVTTACYTVENVSRPYRCGLSFDIFKAYVAANGATSFVDDTTSGSTFPMNEATFMACGSSAVEAEKACYDRHNGNYDDYLSRAMADLDTLRGTVGGAYGNFGKQGKLLASIFYKDHNGAWKPCYPAAYNASLMGVTVEGFETGFEPGNLYLSDSFEMTSFMRDDKRKVLNKRIAKVGGTSLGASHLWSGSEYYDSNVWMFYAASGTLGSNGKMESYGVRGSLAFKFKS